MASYEEFDIEMYQEQFKNMNKHMRKKDRIKEKINLKTTREPIAVGTNLQRSGMHGNWRSGDNPEGDYQESCKFTRQYNGKILKLYFHTVCPKWNHR